MERILKTALGGGNLFAINLRNFLTLNGHQVTTNLNDDDIDIILVTEPRKTSESSAFTHMDVKNYLNLVNSNACNASNQRMR